MAITVGELLSRPELQLSLLAGASGLEQELEWAHTCDLPDPWKWVGARQALLTNGSPIPSQPQQQAVWAAALAKNGIAAIGVGSEMGGPELSEVFLQTCDELALPIFAIPYPLPFVAVAQAVAESATLAKTQRFGLMSRLYDFASRELERPEDYQEILEAVGEIVGRDVAVFDRHCLHSWDATRPLPAWFPARDRLENLSQEARSPTVLKLSTMKTAHVIPLNSLPGALAIFQVSTDSSADQSTLLHAALVLGTALSRRELLVLQENRARSEYLNRILMDQNRFGFESAGWMEKLGYEGPVRAVALVGDRSEREAVVSRLQRHGVQLAVTLQGDRHLLVTLNDNIQAFVEHCLEGTVRAGLGSSASTSEVHKSMKEALWALLEKDNLPGKKVFEYNSDVPWIGFSDPQSGEAYVVETLSVLLDETPTSFALLNTLREYLQLDRSPKRVAESLVIHRQTVIQRLKKVENLLDVDLAKTETISKLWMAVTIHDSLGRHS